ncbi:predicted protein [Naegleria gruberi]|uniref:Predicted protein n=1 Tax=Naegleria gruberi TaxID=5762 RepID=D2W6M2_NAEGR|nr:uncharacterized protein NAEGRDRAFT_54999 [Naegleria gruberi]EFC35280.1 predicted protein [Naegleria gruberi]|eukprot:XP_002668024.1 predicted protein [Naegleria gruberi strain NEG-M]
MRRICKEFNQVIDQELQWKEIVESRLGFSPIPPTSLVTVERENEFWREFFINKIARGKYSCIGKPKKEVSHWKGIDQENEQESSGLLIYYFVESLTKQYCSKLFPQFKYSISNRSEAEINSSSDIEEPEQIYWGNAFEDQKQGFSVQNADDLIAIGESKVGGSPDLPKGMKWPKIEEKFMFGAQINLQHLAYYDRTNSIVPQEGGMLYFFCPEEASGCGNYCNPNSSKPQPVIYVTAKQIKEMGGLERRNGEGSSYCHAAKLLFHNDEFNPRYRTQMVFGKEDFNSDIDIYGDEEEEEEDEEKEKDEKNHNVDYETQFLLMSIFSGDQELVSGDGYMWEWGIPKGLKGQHIFTGCAVCSGDP